MKVIDPGHKYLLRSLDGGPDIELTHVKRNFPPEKYPGNVDRYPGTTSQEVLRAEIDRMRYVHNQHPAHENFAIINHLREALRLFEQRAARIHGWSADITLDQAEFGPICPSCGHVHEDRTC